jgi:Mrp family chromosome partitioning ATPase
VTRYDDALPAFASIVAAETGSAALLRDCFLRDASGRLTFVVGPAVAEAERERIADRAAELAPYVESSASAVDTAEELFDDSLLRPDTGFPEWIDHPSFRGFVRLVERRIVGQDWLAAPREPLDGAPPIAVFASHKGGVGRSTALAVATAALANEGLNVLAIDLDLEAPGLGEILLSEPPRFGTLDYYVESSLSELDSSFFDDMVAVSTLSEGRGRVHIVPAVGSSAASYPQNVLGKIARAYLEKPTADGGSLTFLDRTRDLVGKLTARERYDVVFIDARAGLNEATAAAVLGLGAEVLLFGVDTPQTLAGYRFFLSHLERFRPSSSDEKDWRYRLRMVQAKSPADPARQAHFRTEAFDVFSETINDVAEGLEEEAFNLITTIRRHLTTLGRF